jgi:hypothetical protein
VYHQFLPFGNFLDLCIVLLGLFFDPSRDLAAHSCWTETCCKLLKLSYFYALNYGWWEHTATLCIHYSYRVIYWYCSSLTPTLRLGRDKLRSESPPSKKELAVIWEDWVGVTCECSAPRLVLPDRSIVQQTRSNAKKKTFWEWLASGKMLSDVPDGGVRSWGGVACNGERTCGWKRSTAQLQSWVEMPPYHRERRLATAASLLGDCLLWATKASSGFMHLLFGCMQPCRGVLDCEFEHTIIFSLQSHAWCFTRIIWLTHTSTGEVSN